MCRRPPSVEEPAKDEDVSTPRLGLTFGLLIFLDVAVTCGFSLYAPPRGLNPCALRLFFFGSSTVDLVVLCVARSVASLVVARRVGAVSGGAKRIAELRSHASLAELAYALSKGVSRALGARCGSCDDVTVLFDAACGAYAVFAYAQPWAMARYVEKREAALKRARLSSSSSAGDLAVPLLGGGDVEAGAGDEAKKKEKGEEKSDTRGTLRSLVKIASPDAAYFWAAMVFAVLAALSTSAISLWTGDALDALIKDGDGAQFRKQVGELAVIAAAGAVCTGCRGGLFSYIGVRINVRIRDALFRHLLTLELAYYDETPTGDLNSRLSSDTSKVGDQVSLNVNVFARTFVQLVTTLAFMWHTSPELTLVACCSVPVIGVATKRYGALVWALSKQMQNELAGAMRVAEEAFSSMLTVRSMAAEVCVCADFSAALAKYRKVGVLQACAYSCWQSFNTALPTLMTCLLLFYGGKLVDKGELRSGRLVAFMLLTQSLADSFNTLADMFSNIADALGAADKVFVLLDRAPAADAPPKPLARSFVGGATSTSTAKCAGAVRFEDVHFTYPARPDVPVLRGVSFDCAPGSVVALVGPSGSGKSSCLALLQHFYAPTAGRVLLDGVPVADRDHDWLHTKVAMVGQEPVLFARSIAKNVAYGLEDLPHLAPSPEKIRTCLAMANAQTFIDALPDGVDTDVGERGAALSGGQKQRIAIARALARDPAVLLLDEATSALDAESERNVQEALDDLIKSCGITVIVVAHRLSTVRDADTICVMKKGLLVEEGSHDVLFAREDGVYADLVRRQANISREDSKSLLTAKEPAAAGAD